MSFLTGLLLCVGALLATAPAHAAFLQRGGTRESEPAPAPARVTRRGGDPLPRLQHWLRRQRDGLERLDEESVEELRLVVADLRLLWAVDPARSGQVSDALLDLLGMSLTSFDPQALALQASPAQRVRDLASEALRAHMSDEFARRLAREVLGMPASQPLARRIAAAWLLEGRHNPDTMLALFGCAREPDAHLRRTALDALVGWNDDAVHMFLIDQMASAPPRSGAFASVGERHFASVHLPPESRVRAPLAKLVRDKLASLEWRDASRAIGLSRALDNAAVVPGLIEALSAWLARGASGGQVLRVQHEIARALQERSGRALGLHPDNWRLWWEAVQRGDVRGQHPYTTGGVAPIQVTFFGLHPTSDRITFVIDRSGSMATPFAPGSATTTPNGKATNTRWEEAVSQLLGFVESIGESSRFNVVVFHDYAEVWRPKLMPASAENRRNVREWLSKRPNGGTQLKAGVDRALHLGPDGALDLERVEADTVVVLCDGETAEGPGWVETFLERINSQARIAFHAVQIGSRGDGTLEQLAEGSGGQFVRSDG